jgi:ribose/xylose/arabinose/galactoside ABC-type transport system permease subunit
MTTSAATSTPATTSATPSYLSRYRRSLSTLAVLILMLTLFTIANPRVFLNPLAYKAVFVSLPISILLAVSLVFVIAAGEIDLSFPAVLGLSAWAFALVVKAGFSPWLGLAAALLTGSAAGWFNGVLVTRLMLSSLVATLGMNFLLRGLINIGTQGIGIPLTELRGTPFYNVFVGGVGGFPAQMIWALLFAGFAMVLFNRHKFGANIMCVGDNEDSAREMGISVRRTKTWAFILVGVSAASAGVMSTLINTTFWPSSGDGYLLSTLAAVFVGGTPTWGGVGTIGGAVIGAFIVGFMQTGIIAAGLTGFYTQFFYGLVIILSLVGHRFNAPRYR